MLVSAPQPEPAPAAKAPPSLAVVGTALKPGFNLKLPNNKNVTFDCTKKFRDLNIELNDSVKILELFKKIDADGSKAVDVEEFKKFILDYMKEKKLPAPTKEKIEGILKKYDQNKNGTLDKEEFKAVYFDFFMESLKLVGDEYAAAKAGIFRYDYQKVPIALGVEGLKSMLDLLNDTATFYKELDELAAKYVKTLDGVLTVEQLMVLFKNLFAKYQIMLLNNNHIKEIIEDIRKPEEVYKRNEIQVITRIVLSVSTNLSKLFLSS